MKRYENVSCFLGASPCVGTTMIAQSVAELMASNGVKTLLIICNALSGCNFIAFDQISSLDEFRTQLQNDILTMSELNSLILKRGELNILPGPRSIKDRRWYHPEDMERLLHPLARSYDHVLIDCDTIERGLTVGAMESAQKGFYIVTPHRAIIEAAKLQRQEKALNILPEQTVTVVNQHLENDMLLLPEQINLELKTQVWTVPYTACGWQAESERKTILAYNDKAYHAQIVKIANEISGKTFDDGKDKRTLFKWRS